MEAICIAARISFGGYFLYRGVRHFMSPLVRAVGPGGRRMSLPVIVWGMTGATLVLGGLSFVFGFYPFYGVVWSGSVLSHSAVAAGPESGAARNESALPQAVMR